MDKAIVLGIVMILVACVCSVADSACGSTSCDDDDDCTRTNFVCLAGYCRKCLCNQTSQCRFNSSVGVYCDCSDSGMTGTLCDCAPSGCSCDDAFSFVKNCSSYSNDFEMFAMKKVTWHSNNLLPITTANLGPLNACKTQCTTDDCNLFEYRPQGGSDDCMTYKAVNFMFNNIAIIPNNNWEVHIRSCILC